MDLSSSRAPDPPDPPGSTAICANFSCFLQVCFQIACILPSLKNVFCIVLEKLKNGVAVRLSQLLAALGAPKIKNESPNSDILGPQNAQNATCSQSSSKRNIYNNSPDIVLYLILNKAYVRGFCVLTSTQNGLRFYVKFEMDKKASWRPQEAEQVPTETVFGRF